MKISSFIPGLNKGVTDVKNILGAPTNPYLLINDRGVHRQCMYEIVLDPPKKMVEKFAKDQRYGMQGIKSAKIAEFFDVFCMQATVRSGAIVTEDVRLGGTEYVKVPVGRDYETFNLQFYLDGGYNDSGGIAMRIVQGWLDLIYDPNTRVAGWMDDYKTTITINLYTTPDGNAIFGKEYIARFIAHDAYPITVDNLTVSGTSGSTPTEFNVTFACRNITTEPIASPGVIESLSSPIKNGFRVYRKFKDIKNSIKGAIESVKDIF